MIVMTDPVKLAAGKAYDLGYKNGLADAKEPPPMWVCPVCTFSFHIDHTDEDGGYSCPECAEAVLKNKIEELEDECDRLKAHVARHREQMEDYERLEAERDRLREQLAQAERSWALRLKHGNEAEEERDRLRAALANIEMLARADGQVMIPGMARAALDKEKP